MLYKLPFLISLVILFSLRAQGQSYYNQQEDFLKANGVWTFPPGLGLNFNDPNNRTFSSEIDGSHSCASVSDPQTGELLFYSNGETCWDKTHTVMSNGSNLLGANPHNRLRPQATQGACIVPVIGDSNKFYLFSLEGNDNTPVVPGPSKFYYSVIDMELNGGLGNIVASTKNTLLDSSLLSESMIAVQGENCDIWLITHALDSAIFKAYHITSAGINPDPVISYAGAQLQGRSHTVVLGFFNMEIGAYTRGYMAISPDKTRLAITSVDASASGLAAVDSATGRTYGTLLCNFDPATGKVDSAILIDTVGGYGVAFSPDNSKLYLNSTFHPQLQGAVSQFDITVHDSAAIVASKFIVHAIPPPMSPLEANDFSLKLYKDTIYIERHDLSDDEVIIDRINQPNLSGAACDYQNSAFVFSSATGLRGGLPNDVVFPLPPDTSSNLLTDTFCTNWEDGMLIYPGLLSEEYTYEWNDNTTDTVLRIFQNGTYWVAYNNGCHFITDTIVVVGRELAPEITVNGFSLGTMASYTTYQWLKNGQLIPGAEDSTYTVVENADYSVIVSDGICSDTSNIYTIDNVSVKHVSDMAALITIYPNPASTILTIDAPINVHVQITGLEGRLIKTVQDAGRIDVSGLAAGVYLLHVRDTNGALLKVEKILKQE